MLGVSPKKTEEVDLVKPLAEYIQANFSKQEAKDMTDTLATINNTRIRVMNTCAKHDGDCMASVDLFKQYYGYLSQMSSRFPFGPAQGSSFFKKKVSAITVPFPWYDAFRPQKKGSDVDVNFEKAAMIFNVGAMYSLAGIREDRSNVEGLKKACKLFQQSSGVFAYLSQRPELESVLTVDLTGHCYRMLSHLMLAQAQACFFEQAVKAKMSAGLIAKLAKGTSVLFNNAYAACDKMPLKEWLEKTNYKWQRHILYQKFCFLSASHYWQAKAEIEADEYGNEIAQLYQAREVAISARSHEAELIQGLIDSRSKLQEMIQSRLDAALKDNEEIYHYPVPRGGLKEIEQKFVVTATNFDPEPGPEFVNPFAALVSLKTHENAALYTQTLNSIASEMSRENQEATDTAKMHLASLNLPAALEALGPESGLPINVWTKVREVQLKGGYQALAQLQQEVVAAVKEAQAGLQEIRTIIKKEVEDDAEMKTQFGRRWNRVPSAQINASFVKDADSVDKFLSAAAKSDKEIALELQGAMGIINDIEVPQELLEAKLPKATALEQKTAASEKLRVLLDDLSLLIEKRNAAIKAFQKKISEDNIVSILIASEDKVPVEQTFAEERKKFEPLQKDIAAAFDQQKALLEKVNAANDEFVKTKAKNTIADQREAVLQAINVAVDKFNKLLANLNEGLKFYADIQKDYLEPLKQTCSDFVVAREHEKRLIIEQVTADLAKFNLGNSDNSYAKNAPNPTPVNPQASLSSVAAAVAPAAPSPAPVSPASYQAQGYAPAPIQYDNQGYSAANNQQYGNQPFAPASNQHAPANNQYAPANNQQYAPANNQYAPANNQYAPANNQQYGAPANNQYAPANNQQYGNQQYGNQQYGAPANDQFSQYGNQQYGAANVNANPSPSPNAPYNAFQNQNQAYGAPQGYDQYANAPSGYNPNYNPSAPSQNYGNGGAGYNPALNQPNPNQYAPSSYGAPPVNPNLAHEQNRGGHYQRPQLDFRPPAAAPAPVNNNAAGNWSCPACTFSNPVRAMLCSMCNTANPAPVPVNNLRGAPAAAPAPQQQGGWRNW